MGQLTTRPLLALLCGIWMLAACAPAASGPASTAQANRPPALKTLRIAWHNFPSPGLALFDDSGTGSNFNALIFHSGLTWPDSEGNVQPLLAEKSWPMTWSPSRCSTDSSSTPRSGETNVRGPTWMHPTQQASGWLLHTWDID